MVAAVECLPEDWEERTRAWEANADVARTAEIPFMSRRRARPDVKPYFKVSGSRVMQKPDWKSFRQERTAPCPKPEILWSEYIYITIEKGRTC